jgi:DNA-binding IclR family transcriptional regulator
MIARRQLSAEDLIAGPLLSLMKRTGETVTFSIADIPSRLCVYVLEGPSDLRQVVQAGTRYPLHLGAAGKAILAHLSASVIAGVLENEPLSKAQVTEITKELARIRETGFAVTTGERVPGAMAIGAPVFVGGSIFGSVAAVGPTERMEPVVSRQASVVLDVAKALTKLLTTERAAPDEAGVRKPAPRAGGKHAARRPRAAPTKTRHR